MSLFDKLGSFLKREAADISEAVGQARDRLDDELTAREAELEMTPLEKMRAIQDRQQATDAEFDRLVDEVVPAGADADAPANSADDLQTRIDAPRDTESTPQSTPESTPTGEHAPASTKEAEVTPTAPAATHAAPASDQTFEKSDAERRYEQARQAADDLLEELKQELHDNGEL